MAVANESKAGPNNPGATAEARRLYELLWRCTNEKGFLAGAFDIVVNDAHPHGNNYDRVAETFGIQPAVYSGRYYWTGDGFAFRQRDSKNGAWCAQKINDVFHEHYQKGAILLIHADSSKLEYLGNMLEAKGLVSSLPGVSIHKKFINGIVYLDRSGGKCDEEISALFWKIVEQWADALEDLEKRGVASYLFRPFLEMNSKRFFGDCEEGYAAFRHVWRQVSDYFYKVRKLNGCLLVFAPADYTYLQLSAEAFYPGDEYVDVLAPTAYPSEDGVFQKPTESNYAWMHKAGKPFGFSELSVRTGNWRIARDTPAGDWGKALETILSDYPAAAFVNTWSGDAYNLLPYDEGTGAGNRNGDVFLSSPHVLSLKAAAAFLKK